MNKKVKILLYMLILALTFSYGYLSRHLKIFPDPQLKILKNTFTGAKDHLPNYYHKKSFFEEHGIEGDIVMIGDSLTDDAEWQELFPNKSIINRGIYGDTTVGLSQRTNSILSVNPKKAFIMIGINDIAKGLSVDEIYSNYTNIIETLLSNDIEVIVQSTLYVGEKYSSWNKKVDLLNRKLLNYTEELGITYIDINSNLEDKGKLNPQYSRDSVHLNAKGYSLWKTKIKSIIED